MMKKGGEPNMPGEGGMDRLSEEVVHGGELLFDVDFHGGHEQRLDAQP